MNIETKTQIYVNVDGQLVLRVRLRADDQAPTDWMVTVSDRRTSRDIASQVLMRQGADGRARIAALATGQVPDPGPLSAEELGRDA